MNAATHEIDIRVFGDGRRHYRAGCACGWQGLLRGSRAMARRDYSGHTQHDASEAPPEEPT